MKRCHMNILQYGMCWNGFVTLMMVWYKIPRCLNDRMGKYRKSHDNLEHDIDRKISKKGT